MTSEDLPTSLAIARQRAKPLLIISLNAYQRYETARQKLIQEIIEASDILKNEYELFFCSTTTGGGSYIVSDIVGISTRPNTICKIICLLPYTFNAAALVQRRRGVSLTNLVEPLTGISTDIQRNLLVEILRGSAIHVLCPEHATLDGPPKMLPYHRIISAFQCELCEDCNPTDGIAFIKRLAEYAHALMAPIIVCLRSRQESIEESRLLREQQAEEYRRALQQDQERARQKEMERALQRQKTEEAERQREENARMEEQRRTQTLEMIELARKLNIETRRSDFARICVRINGAKLLCYCHPGTAVRSLEKAIRNLDLILSERDSKMENPVLIVGLEENGIVPAMFINGDDGGGWRSKECGPFGDDYGLVGLFPTQQIARDRSLLQNGIESDCSILWGKLPSAMPSQPSLW